ncbi:MAG: thermosome subunit, partial [Candidatus Pacearchaeota archaeon]|nr:thermosome subunit [Candidatus Pacearchaeota archaeon]
MTDKQPIYILPENVQRMMGRDAQRNNILAARIVADTVKTTLGPKGMDKMLVSAAGDITVTNDGVTILEEMEIEHPAARMMVEIAKTQENEVGDGTTTAVMLAGKLLENAERLLDQKVHPTVITKGYRIASEKALDILQGLCVKIGPENDEVLRHIAMTAMTGKAAEAAKERFAEIIVKAVKQISENGKTDLTNIKIEKAKGEGINQTELISGIVLDKERVSQDMPQRVENAKIALLDSA